MARTEKNEINHIEGKFRQEKSRYKIIAKPQSTAQLLISAIFFVMNILKLSKDVLYSILKSFITKVLLWN